MVLNREASLLRLFIGEADKVHGRPLYEWLVTRARAAGLAGATATRGLMGFGANSRAIHSFKIERLAMDLPIVVEIVDEAAKLEAFLAAVEAEIATGLLATMEKVQVHIYRPDRAP